jgi:NADPH-dependent curcumin reductase CurA
MSSIPKTNRRIVLASRPRRPPPRTSAWKKSPSPNCRTGRCCCAEWLSLDPYMRGRVAMLLLRRR